VIDWTPDLWLIHSLEAGVTISEYQEMSLLELAYTIVGYRQRNYTRLSYERYIAYITMQPHLKKGSLQKAEELFALPTDKEEIVEQMSIEDMKEIWKEQDAKTWAKKGIVGV
jgi:hypothetical protein